MDIKYGYLLRGITVGSPQSRSELVAVVLDSVMAGGDPLLLAVYRLAPQDMTACYSLPGRKDRNLGQYWYTTNRPPHRGRPDGDRHAVAHSVIHKRRAYAWSSDRQDLPP